MSPKVIVAICSAGFLLAASQVWAQKLYKIVDENGNVTFSQFPPKEKSENTKVEDVHVKSSGGKTPVRYVGTNAYCGDIRLPTSYTGSSRHSEEYRAKYMQSKLDDWRERLRDIEQSSQERARRKLNQGSGGGIAYSAKQNSQYQQSMARDTERMRELRCAINWAEEQNSSTAEVIRESGEETQRLQQVHAELERRMIDQCGREPLLDPTDPRNAKDRRQWRACSKKFRNDMRKVEREL
ncbi:DUF4124 domain-containing protein [Simiduia sp. 21SJ11W-1]|uniref:DUF4124 domain-containing protein n=1 Tax=Simiduia sp. 21SJ11W-1 TaxID=2909669 RepID=UPI00209F1B3A|nr:DUF4124 domain-containing protein [Simiduia sp. 21SJ11W-1]UTA49351.1 DUF4124 domain-containing protein [Simiduia sp. 21SJ11W-1]